MASILDGLSWGGDGQPGLLDSLPPWLREAFGGPQQQQPQAGPGMQPQVPMPQPRPQQFSPQGMPQQAPQMPPGGLPPRTPFGEAPKVDGLGNRAYEALGGFLGNEGLIGGGAAAIKTLATGEVTNPYALQKRQQLETYAALQRDFGMTEPQARMAMQNPKVMEALIPMIAPKYSLEQKGPYFGPFDAARGNFNIQGAAPEYQKLDQGQVGGYTAPPLPGGGPAATPPGIPPGTGARPAPAVAGFSQNAGNPAKTQEIDMGTHTAIWDPQTRRTVGMIPKNVQEAKNQTVQGELRGTAAVNLPDTIANATSALGLIDKIENHPGKWRSTGMLGGDWAWSMPGGRAKDFDIAVNQLKSKAFLDAYTQLRGSGAISDKEGQVATAAQARINQAGSEGEFNAALKELRGVIENGIQRAQLKAGRTNTLSTSPPAGYVVQ